MAEIKNPESRHQADPGFLIDPILSLSVAGVLCLVLMLDRLS